MNASKLIITSTFGAALALATQVTFAHDGDRQTTEQHLANDFGLPTATQKERVSANRTDTSPMADREKPTRSDRADSRVSRPIVNIDAGALNVPGRPEFGRIASQ